jgi:hypothetical protein
MDYFVFVTYPRVRKNSVKVPSPEHLPHLLQRDNLAAHLQFFGSFHGSIFGQYSYFGAVVQP